MRSPQPNSRHYPVRVGQLLCNRYIVRRRLGNGAYSRVWQCEDRRHRRQVAIKIHKRGQGYQEAAAREVRLARQFSRDARFVRLLQHFFLESAKGMHSCLVFELLGPDLFERVRLRGPCSFRQVQFIGTQLLRAVRHLHRCGYCHTDVKPENVFLRIPRTSTRKLVQHERRSKQAIMFLESVLFGMQDRSRRRRCLRRLRTNVRRWQRVRVPTTLRIKLGDLGTACSLRNCPQKLRTTPEFRAPEILLGLPCTEKIDVWATACLLFELATGHPLFERTRRQNRHADQQHLARILEYVNDRSRYPRTLINQCPQRDQIFDAKGRLRHTRVKAQPIHWQLSQHCAHWSEKERSAFLVALLPMLRIDPTTRDSAETALQRFLRLPCRSNG